MRTMRRRGLTAALALAYLLVTAGPASAVAPGGAWSYWDTVTTTHNPYGNYMAVGQYIRVETEPTPRAGQVEADSFFAYQFALGVYEGLSNTPAYIGLQKGGVGGPKTAIFSAWDSSGAYCSTVPGALCRPFSNEGTGHQTVIPFDWQPGVQYMLYASRDGDGSNKVNGWILKPDGVRVHIGSITLARPSPIYFKTRNDPSRNVPASASFSEWFGPQPPSCDAQPRAVVRFHPPFYFQVPNWTAAYYAYAGTAYAVAAVNCRSQVYTGAPPWHEHRTGTA